MGSSCPDHQESASLLVTYMLPLWVMGWNMVKWNTGWWLAVRCRTACIDGKWGDSSHIQGM